VQIDDIHVIGISSGPLQETAVYIEESPDKTNSNWDFSNMQMNVLYISGLELEDTIIGTADTDVILGGNGNDSLYGFSGADCIDGGQNDDNLWGDGHTDSSRVVTPGADVFVLNSKLGKDIIHDFSAEQGDMIVNTSNASATVTDNGDGTYTVALKGQNNVLVHVVDGALVKGVNVVDAPLSGFPVCNGYPQ
jgi:Ca2+-binding RTX toxin-like protein